MASIKVPDTGTADVKVKDVAGEKVQAIYMEPTEPIPLPTGASEQVTLELVRLRLVDILAKLPATPATATDVDDVTAAVLAQSLLLDTVEADLGATNEGAAGSDTATSGLNGLLKRLLAKITAIFPVTIDTNSGNKSASTLRVVLATDQPALTTPVPTKEIRAATPTQTSVANSASSVSLLAANANRLGATIFNDDTATTGATLKLKLGATASATSFTVAIAPQGYFEVPYGYTGAIDGIASAATGNARITELAA